MANIGRAYNVFTRFGLVLGSSAHPSFWIRPPDLNSVVWWYECEKSGPRTLMRQKACFCIFFGACKVRTSSGGAFTFRAHLIPSRETVYPLLPCRDFRIAILSSWMNMDVAVISPVSSIDTIPNLQQQPHARAAPASLHDLDLLATLRRSTVRDVLKPEFAKSSPKLFRRLVARCFAQNFNGCLKSDAKKNTRNSSLADDVDSSSPA